MRAASIGCGVMMLAVAGVAGAFPAPVLPPIQQGSTILALQIASGTGDFVSAEGGTGAISPFVQREMGGQIQYWRMVTHEAAFTASGGMSYYREENSPGENATSLEKIKRYITTSWQVRVGGDRLARVNERFALYAGPGVQFWTGRFRSEVGASSIESAWTYRFGLSGRIGMLIQLGQTFGLNAQVGQYLAFATAREAGAQSTWLPSGTDAALGLTYHVRGSSGMPRPPMR